MTRSWRLILAVALMSLGAREGLAPSAAAAQMTTCETADGSYDVSPPAAGPDEGADPAAVAAADCSLGFDERNNYPLSVLVLCIAATVVTLVLVRRNTSYDVVGSQA